MGSSERLHVRWNEYEANIKAEFSVFRQNADFFDVTLAVGSNRLRAHKIILSAFSPLLCS
ncbi:Putative LOC100869307 [Caligus rogercresseyi]|uniref:LOC100869307 n=1 Tax=Caligus rogercresseyi TaxID=217165 RepID=A0A7T8KKY9_CALRO|nr:Putative LOC100869307 [Caligus rogercresseyi]